jgi:hypothetical protein
MRQEVYDVKVSIQWLYDGIPQDFRVKTLASSKEDAEINIRERFRTAYYVKVKEVK